MKKSLKAVGEQIDSLALKTVMLHPKELKTTLGKVTGEAQEEHRDDPNASEGSDF